MHMKPTRLKSSCFHMLFLSVFANVEVTHALDCGSSNIHVGAFVTIHVARICIRVHVARNAIANARFASCLPLEL